jgi:hypothetical protein
MLLFRTLGYIHKKKHGMGLIPNPFPPSNTNTMQYIYIYIYYIVGFIKQALIWHIGKGPFLKAWAWWVVMGSKPMDPQTFLTLSIRP